MPKVSVIIPIYKVEKYIHRCVDSILCQTFTDFELILVDDGSPDNCPQICDEYAQKDSRVSVIHQTNQGQAVARNNGVAQAKAEWICFVDSDDVAHPQMLERLYSAAVNCNVDISACNAFEGQEPPNDFFALRDGCFQTVTMDEEGLTWARNDGKYVYWTIWSKLIRRAILEKHPFTPNRIYEDNAVVCQWLHEAGKITYTNSAYYFYQINEDGTTKADFSLRKLDLLWALEEQISFYDSVGYQRIKKEICAYYLKTAAWYSSRVRNELNNYRTAAEIRKKMQMILCDNPLDTLPLTEEECRTIEKSFHPLREQLRRLPHNVKKTLKRGGVQALVKRILRKFKRY